MSDVESYMSALAPEVRTALDRLRGIAVEADPELVETIKWNAPSFSKNGEDRITLGVERRGGVRAVLHRGSKPAGTDFAFDDQDGLAKWPSPDRGVLVFRDAATIEASKEPLRSLFARWLKATA